MAKAKGETPVAAEQDQAFDGGQDEQAPIDPKMLVQEQMGRTDPVAIELLLVACELFGVNPNRDASPLELAGWRYYPADRRERIPAAVAIVTCGGRKLKIFEDPDYPMDQDTDEVLAGIFNAFTVNPQTKLRERKELPDDLTLPRAAVTGISERADHVYRGGYLRSGGASEAARRAAARVKKK
jgi:hypothetical protein